jgi:serine protease Do
MKALCIGVLAASLLGTAHGKIYSSFAGVAARCVPGVVNIRTTSYIAGKDRRLDPYQFFLNGRLPKASPSHSLGSGVVVDRNGYILTNYHVISGADVIEVLLAQSKKKVRAKVVGFDVKTDLALLKVKSKLAWKPLDLGNSDKLRVGDIILAIGNPFGFSHTVTSGIISAKGRVIGTGPYDDFLQTDASIHPGNSGGPLIDIRGRVVGIATAVSSDGPGIGFAIPINIAKEVMYDLKKHGKVVRPWLGVVGQNILSSDEMGDAYDRRGTYGVIVANLVVDGPAQKAGLKMGDLITTINRAKIYDLNQFQRVLNKHSPDDRITLRVYRSGKGFITVNVALAEIPTTSDLPKERDLF